MLTDPLRGYIWDDRKQTMVAFDYPGFVALVPLPARGLLKLVSRDSHTLPPPSMRTLNNGFSITLS